MTNEDIYIPAPSYSGIANDIEPIAEFIGRKIVSLRQSLRSSTDLDEKIDIIASLVMCESAISLLQTAYLLKSPALIESAKNIWRNHE